MVARVSRSDLRRYSAAGTVLGFVVFGAGLVGAAYVAGRGQSSELRDERPRAFVPEFNVVEVPVPERPVPAGIFMRDVAIRFEKYPEHQLPRGAVRKLDDIKDSVALVALPGGLPILSENIGSTDEATNPVIGRIPPGMRAMTVRVDATAAVEGWARSGSVVDVLLIEKNRTTVVAEQVKVISAERSLAPMDASGTAPIPSTVTLLVTQEQCLAINTAVPMGKIAFALRSNRDSGSWRDTHFSSEDLAEPGAANENLKVQGVVLVGEGDDARRFALINGSWLPADELPAGFLLGQGHR